MKRAEKKILLLCFLIVSLLACRRGEKANLLVLSGTLEMTEHNVGMPASGRVATLNVDEGDEVKRGQLLATLDRYDLVAREYNRSFQLLSRGGTNQQAVEEAEMAMLDQRVLSPVDGVVLTKVHETGEVVPAGNPILILGDRSKIWVRVYVPEGMINRVTMGQGATLRLDGLQKEFKGRVSFIAPQAEFTPRNVQTPEERVTQTFAVKVVVEEVTPSLRPGVSADVVLPLAEEKP